MCTTDEGLIIEDTNTGGGNDNSGGNNNSGDNNANGGDNGSENDPKEDLDEGSIRPKPLMGNVGL